MCGTCIFNAKKGRRKHDPLSCKRIMKRKLLLFISVIGILTLISGCSFGKSGSTSKQDSKAQGYEDQVVQAAYQVDENWQSRTLTPNYHLNTSEGKRYQYADYQISVVFKSTAAGSLKQELREAASSILDTQQGEVKKTVKETNIQLAGKEAIKQSYTWEISGLSGSVQTAPGETGHMDSAGFETDMGMYLITALSYSEKGYETAKSAYQALLDSVTLTEGEEAQLYVRNTGQGGGFAFRLPDWNARTEDRTGTVVYGTEDIEAIAVRTLKNEKLSKALMEASFKELYSRTWTCGFTGQVSKAEVTKQEQVKIKDYQGDALLVNLDLTMKSTEQPLQTKASALFVRDEEGKAVCCFSALYDEKQSYEYSDILQSLVPLSEIETKADRLWEKKTQYIGNNTKVAHLLQETDLKDGGAYTMELDTEKEPYGLIVHYDKPVKEWDDWYSDTEAALLLGLIENLDYVELRSGTETNKITCDDADGILGYDVKQLGKEKAKLQAVVLKDKLTWTKF